MPTIYADWAPSSVHVSVDTWSTLYDQVDLDHCPQKKTYFAAIYILFIFLKTPSHVIRLKVPS